MFQWFQYSHRKSNIDNCHLIPSSKSAVCLKIQGKSVKSKNRTKLLDGNIEGLFKST